MNYSLFHRGLINIFLLLALVLVFCLSLGLGSVYIPIDKILGILSGHSSGNPAWDTIITEFRLPKALTAILTGAALSISGLQMQTLFRNPLAGPFVLGISSGASLGVALLILASSTLAGWGLVLTTGPVSVVVAAAIGSALVFLLIMGVSVRLKDSMSLLIVGLMIGSGAGAIVGVLQYFSSAEQIQVYLFWTFGSLGRLGWDEIGLLSLIFLIGMTIVFMMQKALNALLLGENYAQSMGLSLDRARIWIIISTSLLAGGATAFCGPIAFIGLAVPHFARMAWGSADHRFLIPASAILGGIVLLICDMAAQLPGLSQSLPINAVTSLIGAPVVIWIVLKRRNLTKTFAG